MEAEELIAEYKDQLQDLISNSKPLINALTWVAQENMQYAAQLSQCIIKRILTAPEEGLLPALYLLDSIAKNVGGLHISLFSSFLDSDLFSNLFFLAPPNIRASLLRLF